MNSSNSNMQSSERSVETLPVQAAKGSTYQRRRRIRRINFAQYLCNEVRNGSEFLKRSFSDECKLSLSRKVSNHNFGWVAQSVQNKHTKPAKLSYGFVMEQLVTKRNKWTHVYEKEILTEQSYGRMLHYCMITSLRNYSKDVIRQQKDAPPDCAAAVRQYLDLKLANCWIWRAGPIPCPPRSVDLNPSDHFLRKYRYSFCPMRLLQP